jgi:HSP20 family molecular chaperone IbpA
MTNDTRTREEPTMTGYRLQNSALNTSDVAEQQTVEQTGGQINLWRRTLGTSAGISPIERWSDNNYVPRSLEYSVQELSDTYQITTPVHNFAPHEIHIDAVRGCLIILFSHGYDVDWEEFYCEIELPADANPKTVTLEIVHGSLFISLPKKVASPLANLTSGLKGAAWLLFGAQKNLSRADN